MWLRPPRGPGSCSPPRSGCSGDTVAAAPRASGPKAVKEPCDPLVGIRHLHRDRQPVDPGRAVAYQEPLPHIKPQRLCQCLVRQPEGLLYLGAVRRARQLADHVRMRLSQHVGVKVYYALRGYPYPQAVLSPPPGKLLRGLL